MDTEIRDLPHRLPPKSEDLVRELDEIVQRPDLTNPYHQSNLDQLNYEIGRRSVVDELIRLLPRS